MSYLREELFKSECKHDIVLLGESGAGKTLFLIKLMKDLVEK